MISISRPQDIGALARARRRALGLTQVQFADRLGTSQDWVSRIESGKQTLQGGLVLRALRELNITLFVAGAAASKSPNPQTRKRPRVSLKDIVDG